MIIQKIIKIFIRKIGRLNPVIIYQILSNLVLFSWKISEKKQILFLINLMNILKMLFYKINKSKGQSKLF